MAEERTTRRPGEDVASSYKTIQNAAQYLEALVEARRELSRQPADEWECGHIIMLYASVTALAAQRKSVEEALSGAQRVYDTKFKRSLLALDRRLDSILTRYCRVLDSFLEMVVNLAEILIARRYPTAHAELSACITDRDDEKDKQQVLRLNAIVQRLKMPDGNNMLQTWLISFDKPSEPSFRGSEDDILGGSYWRGDIRDDAGMAYRQPELNDRLHASLEFVDACAEVIRKMLSTADGNLRDATLGLVNQVNETR